jgi:hypothetical protein
MSSMLPAIIVGYKRDSSTLPAYISCTLPAIVVCYKGDGSALPAYISSMLPVVVVCYKCVSKNFQRTMTHWKIRCVHLDFVELTDL